MITTPSVAERHRYTLQMLHKNGHVSVADLSKQLQVSEVTIRKDLGQLEQLNLLVRTHGGAVIVDHYAFDVPFDEKAKHMEDEKKRIGRMAADLITDNDTVILDSGTTTLQIARNLRGKKEVTVATNSIHIAVELLRNSGIEFLILGGLVRPSSASIIGPNAEEMLKGYSFRKLFLAGDGLDVEFGLTTTHAMEAHLNQVMIENSQQVIVVVDSSKFGRRGLCKICGLDSINTIITDKGASDTMVEALEEQGIDVIRV